MNIALLMESSAWGGAEGHAAGFIRVLQSRGHLATLIGINERAHDVYRKRAPDIPYACLEAPRPSDEMSFFGWRKRFARQPWDICMLIKGDI